MNSYNNNISVWQIFLTFLVLGLTSFGGPIAHIGYFHQAFIKQRKWLTESEFSQMLAVCQFIPGPASSQLGFAIGLAKGGVFGALAAFIGFTLPSVLMLVAFVSFLPLLSNGIGEAIVHGLKLVAVIVVADAVLGMASKLCSDWRRRFIAILVAAVLILVSSTYLQLGVIVFAAVVGICLFRRDVKVTEQSLDFPVSSAIAKLCLALFSVLLLFSLTSFNTTESQTLASLFQAGSLVFGGGHVVLPYLEQSFVGQGLIDKETFLAGYGATQAVPGPLFTFASYISAVVPTELPLWLMVTLGTLAVFTPGFLLLIAVLPTWQKISGNVQAQAAVAGINAAVVGILAASLYHPIISSSLLSWVDLVIALIGFVMLNIWKKPPIWVVAWALSASLLLTI